MNNFEKIKSLTLDEMAEFLSENVCEYCEYLHNDCDAIECKDGIKQWLETESEVRE